MALQGFGCSVSSPDEFLTEERFNDKEIPAPTPTRLKKEKLNSSVR